MKRVVLLRSNPVKPDPPVEKVALSLVNAGYRVTIVGWDRDSDYPLKNDTMLISGHRVRVVRFGIKAVFSGGLKKNLFPLIAFQMRLRSWLIRNRAKYDIIHAFDFDTGFLASRYARKYGKKFVYHILDYYVASHGLRGSAFEKPVVRLENSVIDFADATVICTEQRREQIAGANPKRLVVIHNTPSTAQIKPCPSKVKPTDRMKIVYVGILESSRMLREIAAAVSENSDVEIHVGGFGTLDPFFTEMAQKHDNIFFYGRLPYDQTLSLENECDIMLAIYDPEVDNHRYAAPNKFYESLMLGKPLVMVRGTGMSQIVEENAIGVLIDYSKEGFEDGINRLIGMKDGWKDIEVRMKTLYREQFCWDEMERRLIQLYEQLQ